MKKLLGITLGAIILMAVACGDDDPVSHTPPLTGIKINLSVSPTDIQYGQSAEINIRVTNEGPNTIVLDFGCRDHIGYQLEAAGGSMIYRYPGLCEVYPHKLTIAPGWTDSLTENLPSTLPPTLYTVKAGILEHEDEYPWATSELYVRY